MDQMDAFEQQLANVSRQVAGPIRSVDAMAVVRSVKADPDLTLSTITRLPCSFCTEIYG